MNIENSQAIEIKFYQCDFCNGKRHYNYSLPFEEHLKFRNERFGIQTFVLIYEPKKKEVEGIFA